MIALLAADTPDEPRHIDGRAAAPSAVTGPEPSDQLPDEPPEGETDGVDDASTLPRPGTPVSHLAARGARDPPTPSVRR